jgi:hypothetical protein
MDNWQSKIDDHLRKQEEKKFDPARIRKRDIIAGALSQISEQVRNANRQRHMSNLARKFECSVCHTPSQQPASKISHYETVHPNHEFATSRSVPVYEEDWKTPGDMTRCSICHNFVCKKTSCIYKGICKNCGQNFS